MEHSDELSLIDLILIFIKRRYYFLMGFIISLILSLGVSYKLNSIDTYVTVLALSSFDNELASKPESLIVDLDTKFYYGIISSPELKKMMGQTKYFSPKNSTIIKIETKGNDQERIRAFHKRILDHLVSLDSANFKQKKENLEKRISEIDVLVRDPSSKSSKLTYEKELGELRLQLSLSQLSTVLLDCVTKESIGEVKLMKFLSVAVMLSLIIGVFTVVLAEIINSVRLRLQSCEQK